MINNLIIQGEFCVHKGVTYTQPREKKFSVLQSLKDNKQQLEAGRTSVPEEKPDIKKDDLLL